jgi:GntR family transcriptional regulator/MocR family aminotransferase
VKAASSVKEISGWSFDQVDDDDRALIEQLRLSSRAAW